MALAALFLGSIGTVTETSELQREAFNAAFADAGLDWQWDRTTYQAMLADSGGAQRIRRYAEARGDTVDAAALHVAKTEHFHRLLMQRPPDIRDGLGDLLHMARDSGTRLAFVTSTDEITVQRVIESTNGLLGRDQLAFVGHAGLVDAPKPDPAIYQLALEMLGIKPDEALAIEDNPDGVKAAAAARIRCIAFPGANHLNSIFEGAVMTTHSIAPSRLGLMAG